MASWVGGVVIIPPNHKKFLTKTWKMQSIWVFASVLKIFWKIFKTIFKTFISSGGLSRDHYWRGGIHEIHDWGFWEYLSDFFIFLHEISFHSKILSSSCDEHQKFDYMCSRYTEEEAKCPDIGRSLTILGIFEPFVLAQAFSLNTWLFY